MFDHATILAAMSHARLEYPRESCGLVVCGAYRPCDNTAADPLTDFRVSPEDWIYAESFGPVQAVIHSHPDGPDHPSKADMIGQLSMTIPWGIVTVVDGQSREPFFWGEGVPIPPLTGRVFRSGVTDCWSLARDWYREHHSATIPDFPREPGWDADENLFTDNLALAGFREAAWPPEHGDGLLFRVGARVVNHCGVYVGSGRMLHHLENRLSCPDLVGRWQRLLVGVVRRVAP